MAKEIKMASLGTKMWLLCPDGEKIKVSIEGEIGEIKMDNISYSCDDNSIGITGCILGGTIPSYWYNQGWYASWKPEKETSDEFTKKLSGELTDIAVGHFKDFLLKQFYPTRIIYNPPYTICYFGDDKVIVKCSDFDEFKPDFGVMACIMRKMFDTRAEFDRLVESGSWQEPKEKKQKAK